MSVFAKGLRTGLYVSSGTPITLTTRAHHAAGATGILLRSSQLVTLLAGTHLQFGLITVTIGAETTLPKNIDTGVPLATPLTAGLSVGATTSTHEPLRVLGTSDSNLMTNTRFQDVTDVVSGSDWTQQRPVQRSWSLDRNGNFRATDPAFKLIRQAFMQNEPVRITRILPDENGNPDEVQHGTAFVSDLSNPSPADGIITASWVFQGTGPVGFGEGGQLPVPPVDTGGIMLDFSDRDNSINLGFL